MKTTERILLALVRAGLETEQASIALPEEIDWEDLFRTAAEQGVLAIAFDGIMQTGANLPKPLLFNWIANIDRIERKYEHQKRVLGKLTACFDKYSIPVLLLKGYGLSLCYPKPEHRPCGDIDLWLYGKADSGNEILRREFGAAFDDRHQHHAVGSIDGVTIENHFEFLNTSRYASNAIVERRLQQLSRTHFETIAIDGHPLRLPSPDLNALFLLRHTACHFANERIVIRHLADWAMFVSHCGKHVNWSELESFAREMNMHRFLYALNALSVDLLGVKPDMLPPLHRNRNLERRIIEDILNPRYSLQINKGEGIVASMKYSIKRWRAKYWKLKIVYSDSLALTSIKVLKDYLSGR